MAICLHNAILLTGFSKMEDCAVLIEDGTIVEVFSQQRFQQRRFDASVRTIDVNGAYIAPGFIDTHIHGFKGNGTDECSTEAILQMSIDLAQYGVTAFNPTMYPASEKKMIYNIKEIVRAMGKEDGAKIMGIHLEGPFVSPEKIGALGVNTAMPVDIDLLDRLWVASEGKIVNMTIAPELKNMRYLALSCLQKGIVLQAGHTNADYQHMVEGMQAGVLHATHLFNAMSQIKSRNPGAVGAVLIHPEMSCEIISDGVHIHPALIKLLMRNKSADKIVLVTDCLRPAEQKSGTLFANGEEVVFKNGCFHRAADDVISGSALTMIRGVQNLVQFDFPIENAVKAASANPASIMRYQKKGFLIPGYDADLLVFDKAYTVLATMIGGVFKKNIL